MPARGRDDSAGGAKKNLRGYAEEGQRRENAGFVAKKKLRGVGRRE